MWKETKKEMQHVKERQARDKMSTYCKTAVDVFPNEIVEV